MRRRTTTGVIGAIGTGTESAGSLTAFLRIIVKVPRVVVRQGGVDSTAEQPGRETSAENIYVGQQREMVRKAERRVDRRQDDIDTATRRDAEDTVSESELREGSIF